MGRKKKDTPAWDENDFKKSWLLVNKLGGEAATGEIIDLIDGDPMQVGLDEKIFYNKSLKKFTRGLKGVFADYFFPSVEAVALAAQELNEAQSLPGGWVEQASPQSAGELFGVSYEFKKTDGKFSRYMKVVPKGTEVTKKDAYKGVVNTLKVLSRDVKDAIKARKAELKAAEKHQKRVAKETKHFLKTWKNA